MADQQLIEIAKALSVEARVLILDEPTASLSAHEVERLFTIVRRPARPRRRGPVREPPARRGVRPVRPARRSSATAGTSSRPPTSELTTADLVRHMVGRDGRRSSRRSRRRSATCCSRSTGLTRGGELPRRQLRGPRRRDRRAWPGWSAPGGRRSRASCSGSTSATPARSGSAARPVAFASPSAAMDAGHRLPARGPPPGGPRPRLLDRPERHAADPAAPVPAAPRRARRRSARSPTSYTEQFDVRMTGVDQPVGALSGGNQQKVVLAKWLASKPRVLILDEPTRGIDIGAKVEVHRIISELAASGLGDHPHLERPARGPRDVRPDPRPPRGPDHRRDRRATERPRSGSCSPRPATSTPTRPSGRRWLTPVAEPAPSPARRRAARSLARRRSPGSASSASSLIMLVLGALRLARRRRSS